MVRKAYRSLRENDCMLGVITFDGGGELAVFRKESVPLLLVPTIHENAARLAVYALFELAFPLNRERGWTYNECWRERNLVLTHELFAIT